MRIWTGHAYSWPPISGLYKMSAILFTRIAVDFACLQAIIKSYTGETIILYTWCDFNVTCDFIYECLEIRHCIFCLLLPDKNGPNLRDRLCLALLYRAGCSECFRTRVHAPISVSLTNSFEIWHRSLLYFFVLNLISFCWSMWSYHAVFGKMRYALNTVFSWPRTGLPLRGTVHRTDDLHAVGSKT